MKKNNKSFIKIQEDSSKLARWIALYEAINYCADKAEEKKISFNKITLKPLDIQKYISSVEDIILKKILKEEYNIDIHYSEDSD